MRHGSKLIWQTFTQGHVLLWLTLHLCQNPSMHTCLPEAQTRRSSFLLLLSSASFIPCGCSAHSRGCVHECRPPGKSTASPIRPAFIATKSPSLLTPPVCQSPLILQQDPVTFQFSIYLSKTFISNENRRSSSAKSKRSSFSHSS